MRLIIIILLSLTVFVCKAQEGIWSGELDLGSTKVPLVFHFDADGCAMDSPSQGVQGIKVEKSFSSDGKLKIEIPMIGASYEGFVIMKIISGTFKQGGTSLPLTLKPGEPKLNRPQTPKAPFPYILEEVTFQNNDFTFHGTLTMPKEYTKETPVLVMVTGSGQQNRDEEMMGHRPFAVIADALARQGIATMRFDDRGYDDPTFPYLDFAIAHHAADAEAGVKLMRKRFCHVGVIGHSEGGTIALMLASKGDVDFCISLAGMAISGKETLLNQNRTMLRCAGISSSDIDNYCKALDKAFDDLNASKDANNIDDSQVPIKLKDNFRAAMKQLSTYYMRDFIKLDVSKDLQKIKCPVLALNGEKDIQVNSESNLSAIDNALTNCKHEIVEFEGLNHMFQHCQTGLPNEYQMIEETFAPEALNKIIEWIKTLQ